MSSLPTSFLNQPPRLDDLAPEANFAGSSIRSEKDLLAKQTFLDRLVQAESSEDLRKSLAGEKSSIDKTQDRSQDSAIMTGATKDETASNALTALLFEPRL